MSKLIITPKTKIFDLLEAYPELENVLIEIAPQFSKLKNPLLRKTITKITNLSQAATIGGLNVEQMINKLRNEVGQSAVSSFETENSEYNTDCPGWFKESRVIRTIDIRDMLHVGEQPVHEVFSSIKKLKNSDILKVIAPFIPAPLIDKSLSLNYKHWLNKRSEDEYWIFFHS
ncbi:MAG: DUF1858 domain-containing protein [Bacteroidales bacterium]|nr:DUF1858 domain-containing protein [Bacteroidales bacterium]